MFIIYAIALNFNSVYIEMDKFMIIYASGLLNAIATDSLFQVFAYAFPDAEQALPPCMLCFTFFQTFNGVAPSPNSYPTWLEWAPWVSPIHYQMGICVDTIFI